jgi:uncharacterized protein YkwD
VLSGVKAVCFIALVSGLAVCALPAAATPGPIHAAPTHTQGLDRKRGSGPRPSTGSPQTTQTQAARSAPAGLAALESDVLAQLNAIRVQHRLVPLTTSAALTASADQHTIEMAADGYFAHNSQDGTPFWKRIQQWYPQGTFHYWAVGENLVWESPDLDAPGAMELWMGSPEHRANILDPKWREIGVSALHADAAPGTYQGLGVTIVTTDFGVRK